MKLLVSTLLSVVAIGLGGCGSDTGNDPESDGAQISGGDEAAVTEQSVPQEGRPDPGSTVKFHLITGDLGWEYDVELLFDRTPLTASKDVSTSPPGRAVLRYETADIPLSSVGTLQGRLAPAVITEYSGFVVDTSGIPTSLCESKPISPISRAELAQPDEIYCYAVAQTQDGGPVDKDVTEVDADQSVSLASNGTGAKYVFLYLRIDSEYCFVRVFPDGAVDSIELNEQYSKSYPACPVSSG